MKPKRKRRATLKSQINSQIRESLGDRKGKRHVRLKKDTPKSSQTKTGLSARAKAQKELEKEHAFEGNLKTIYQKPIDVNQSIRIENIGKLFTGNYIIDSATIEFRAGNLETSLDLIRDVN